MSVKENGLGRSPKTPKAEYKPSEQILPSVSSDGNPSLGPTPLGEYQPAPPTLIPVQRVGLESCSTPRTQGPYNDPALRPIELTGETWLKLQQHTARRRIP